MYRFLIPTTFMLVMVFAILTLIASIFGSTYPSNTALQGFTEGCQDKPQPCWYGVVPGETTMQEAEQILTQLGYTLKTVEDPSPLDYWQTDHPQHLACQVDLTVWPMSKVPGEIIKVVQNLNLWDCKNIQLGDLLLMFKKPVIAYNCFGTIGGVTFGGTMWLNPFPFTASPQLNKNPILAKDEITSIAFDQRTPPRISWLLTDSWYGFMMNWKLTQIIHDQYCSKQM